MENQFKKAVHVVRNGSPSGDQSTETRLNFYKYFKQATLGMISFPSSCLAPFLILQVMLRARSPGPFSWRLVPSGMRGIP